MDDIQQVTLTNAGPVPIQGSQPNQSVNPVMDSMSSALKQQQKAVDDAAAALKQTPQYVTGSSATPVMPVQKPTPFGHSSVQNLANVQPQTKGGAKAKGIGMIAAQAGNFVGTFFKKKQEEKTQALAQDISRSLELQKGMDEAKQILQQDPNNQQAKMQLQKNQTQLQALLSGKNGKEIAKAYDITFGEGAQKDAKDKANDPAHKAMQDAMKQHQEEERLEKFEAQQPQRMSPNSAYAARQQELATQQKQLESMQKVYGTMSTAVMKEQGADRRADQADATRRAGIDNANLRTMATLEGRQEALKQEHQNRLSEISARGAQERNNINLQKDNAGKLKVAELWFQSADKDLTSAKKELNDLQSKLGDLKKNTSDEGEYEKGVLEFNSAIRLKQKEIQALSNERVDALANMQGNPDVATARSLIDKSGKM